jgi:LacI family transcriptional regulator
MPVTIRDVAQNLGLSIATVSRALDGYPDIALETRQRVQQTAKEMGYIPNRAARQLRRKRADAIGYILPSDTPRFADPYFAEFLVGLSDETAHHPFDLLISIADPDGETEQRIYENWVRSRKVDGFVLNRLRRNDWRVRFLSEQRIPFTALEHAIEAVDHPRIVVDNTAGMVELVLHLASVGYRRLAYIGGPEALNIHLERLAGFRQGLETAGLPFDPTLCLPGDLTSDAGYQAARRMRWLTDSPDAIVCVNDETAFGVLHALHEMGFKAGQEIGVTGFDGVQASRHTDPPLTTLDIPVSEIARRLVRMLDKEMTNRPQDERQIVIQPRLLVRESTYRKLSEKPGKMRSNR